MRQIEIFDAGFVQNTDNVRLDRIEPLGGGLILLGALVMVAGHSRV